VYFGVSRTNPQTSAEQGHFIAPVYTAMHRAQTQNHKKKKEACHQKLKKSEEIILKRIQKKYLYSLSLTMKNTNGVMLKHCKFQRWNYYLPQVFQSFFFLLE